MVRSPPLGRNRGEVNPPAPTLELSASPSPSSNGTSGLREDSENVRGFPRDARGVWPGACGDSITAEGERGSTAAAGDTADAAAGGERAPSHPEGCGWGGDDASAVVPGTGGGDAYTLPLTAAAAAEGGEKEEDAAADAAAAVSAARCRARRRDAPRSDVNANVKGAVPSALTASGCVVPSLSPFGIAAGGRRRGRPHLDSGLPINTSGSNNTGDASTAVGTTRACSSLTFSGSTMSPPSLLPFILPPSMLMP